MACHSLILKYYNLFKAQKTTIHVHKEMCFNISNKGYHKACEGLFVDPNVYLF